METRQLIKMLTGAVAIAAVVIAIAALIPSKAKAEPTQVNQTVTELGTAMKGWAMALGSNIDIDIERLKNSGFFQHQKKGFEQGKEQFARNREQIRQLPSRIKEDTTDLFATIAKALGAITGGKNNDGKTEK